MAHHLSWAMERFTYSLLVLFLPTAEETENHYCLKGVAFMKWSVGFTLIPIGWIGNIHREAKYLNGPGG